jgi:hypothetical protein
MYTILHITTGEYVYSYSGTFYSGELKNSLYKIIKVNSIEMCNACILTIVEIGIYISNSKPVFHNLYQTNKNEFEIIRIGE